MLPEYRHSSDLSQMEVLETKTTLKLMLTLFNNTYASITSIAKIVERNFLVTEDSFPRIYRLFSIAKEKLELTQDIPLFLNFEDALSAQTVGSDKDCAIILNCSCLDTLSDGEILAMLGHELGHIHCHHVNYLNIITFFEDITSHLAGITETTTLTIKNLLVDWLRCAEYSADRAAAIITEDIDIPLNTLVKCMGGAPNKHSIELNPYKIVKQIDYLYAEENINKVSQIVFQNLMAQIELPFAIFRMKELMLFGKTAECKNNFPYLYYKDITNFNVDIVVDADYLYTKSLQMLPNNHELGLFLLHSSAKYGNALAMDQLGTYYIFGKELPKNVPIGIRYLKNAASKQLPTAYTHLGMCYVKGLPPYLEQNKTEGYHLLQYAVGLGEQHAKELITNNLNPIQFTMDISIKQLLTKFSDKDTIVSNFNSEENEQKLRTMLLIPRQEEILAYEINKNYARQAIAICNSGVYVRSSNAFPIYLPWTEISKKDLRNSASFDQVDTMLDNTLIYSYDINQTPAIIQLLTFIKQKLK